MHIVPVDGGWALRVGRRIETTFVAQLQAVEAGMRRARQLSAKLLLHKEDGKLRELGTSEADELLLQVWKDTYAHHNAGKMD